VAHLNRLPLDKIQKRIIINTKGFEMEKSLEKILTCRITPEDYYVYNLLKKEAKQKDLTMSELIRKILKWRYDVDRK